MTPRVDLTFLAATASFRTSSPVLKKAAGPSSVSRGDDREDVSGFLNTMPTSLPQNVWESRSVSRITSTPSSIFPSGLASMRFLEHFRQTHSHTALIVDERGDVVGMADIEDAVMPLVRATSFTQCQLQRA